MSICVAVCLYVYHVHADACGSHKSLKCPELQLWVVMSYHVSARSPTWFSSATASALHH